MRLTIQPDADHGDPVWSPDGKRIAFAVLRGKFRVGIYQEYSSGAGGEELLAGGLREEDLAYKLVS